MSDMSPLKMLQKLRSSSSEWLRTKRPKSVMRSSGGSSSPLSSRMSAMLRNLTSLNVPRPRPVRSCLNSIGEPTSRHVSSASTPFTGASITRASPDRTTSIARFPKRA